MRRETPLERIASCGINNNDCHLRATAMHLCQEGVDADAIAADIGFVPNLSVDRQQIGPPINLQSKAAEVEERLTAFVIFQ